MKPVNILLVEDDRVDAKAFLRAIKSVGFDNPVTVVCDGVEAWDLLKGNSATGKFPRPSIVVLDVNMPRMTGIELLSKIRKDEELSDLVVFMLTTSDDQQDISGAYELNVAGYMLKSELGQTFIKAVELLNQYWQVVELPSGAKQITNHAA